MAGEAYMKQLRAHPLLTKAVSSGVLAGCSDAIAQKIAGIICNNAYIHYHCYI
jgi:peroxisomal membrane protein 2/protein Mpv17